MEQGVVQYDNGKPEYAWDPRDVEAFVLYGQKAEETKGESVRNSPDIPCVPVPLVVSIPGHRISEPHTTTSAKSDSMHAIRAAPESFREGVAYFWHVCTAQIRSRNVLSVRQYCRLL